MTTQDLSRQLTGRTATLSAVSGKYAVLIPLVEGEHGLNLLFEVRSAQLRRQPNEICYPGGRMEAKEAPHQAALRETQEELGLPPSALELIAPMDYLGYQSGLLLYPFLGRIDAQALANATPNPQEVQELFQVPLDFFLHNEPEDYHYDLVPQAEDFPYDRIGRPKGYAFRGGRVGVPVYHWENRIIWGLTARITWGMVQTLRQECNL